MALALEPYCSFYGLASGAAYASTVLCIQSRDMASGLLNPWLGILGLASEAISGTRGSKMAASSCAPVLILGPLLADVVGAAFAYLTNLNGSE